MMVFKMRFRNIFRISFLPISLKTNLFLAIWTNSSISSVGVKLTIDLEIFSGPGFGDAFRLETGPEIVKGLYSEFPVRREVRREPRVRPLDWLVVQYFISSGLSSISLRKWLC